MHITRIWASRIEIELDGKDSINVERFCEKEIATDKVDLKFCDHDQDTRLQIILPDCALIQLKAEIDKFLLTELKK